jgi:hypothetical protein
MHRKTCVDLKAPLHTLVPSSKGAAANVEQIKLALSRGYTLRAGVISGTHIGQGWSDHPQLVTGKPDHYLIIIGYEARASGKVFVFWDPDATVSPFHGRGFGHLYFVDKARCGPPGANVHQFGRFTTAPPDTTTTTVNLEVDHDGYHTSRDAGFVHLNPVNGHHMLTPAKRYQVMFVDVIK